MIIKKSDRVRKMYNLTIPIFYACDDGYVKYMYVAMQSLIKNASKRFRYHIHVLHEDISYKNMELILGLQDRNFTITFENVTDQFKKLNANLPLRDYYSKTTYYRLVLPEMFSSYDKAIYLDSDTIVLGDISELYRYNMGSNYIAAARDRVIGQWDTFTDYAEKVLGISHDEYFNAGVVLINCRAFRNHKILKKFNELHDAYSFVVAQDQDYLNVLCKDHVYWLPDRWNAQTFRKLACPEEEISLIHYNLAKKPWFYKDSMLGSYFWDVAKNTPFYEELKEGLENYTEDDKKEDEKSGEHLFNLAVSELNKDDNYMKKYGNDEERSFHRMQILNKIEQYEREGRFDEDVEDDPPTIELKPEDIEYIEKTVVDKVKTIYSFRIARWFMNNMIRKKQLIFKEVKGIENINSLKSGAIITCNHFNPFDVFAVQHVYDLSIHKKKRTLYRVIREGNYTNFQGFYGVLMRNCNTLPLSSNKQTSRKFLSAVDTLLKHGHFVMMYPEQSLWWNYKKPKPLKKGAFLMAAKSKVPVLPVFITMEDTKYKDSDGYPVQAYTINILPPLYPDKHIGNAENARQLMNANYNAWKNVYESFYKTPLVYLKNEADAE